MTSSLGIPRPAAMVLAVVALRAGCAPAKIAAVVAKKPVWSDGFSGAAGTLPHAAKRGVRDGRVGWG